MTGNTREWLRAAITSLAILLTACGGGGGSGAANNGGGGGGGTGGGGAASFTVGGTVSGLSGAGLILQINGGADLTLTSSGNFNFAVPVVVGASYNVSIRAQPSNPTQTCALSNASGTIGSANVTNVTVTCTTNIYSVGGVVSGLSVDAGLVLQSGSEELPVSRNGSFVFATGVASGAIYNVTVRAQPTAPVQTCAVTNATGTMGAAEVSNVVVSCDGIALLAGALGGPGSIDGMGAVARFKRPADVAIDPLGNIYVSDSGNRTVRKITAAGVVSTVAGMVGQSGSDDGNGSAARFFAPAGMTADSAGNVYVADSTSHVIRRITPAGDVTTLAGAPGQSGSADGAASVARFWVPSDIVGDASGNLYVADSFNHTIRRITPAGVVSTFAGTARQFGTTNGTGSAARFNAPRGLVIDAAGNLYVTDTNNHTIRKITPGAVVTTFAGTPGQFGAADGSPALFSRPDRIGIDAAGDLLVTDTGNHTIRRITPAGVTSTFAGLARTRGSVDGVGSAARFSNPIGLAVDAAGNTYVADDSNHAIRKITPAGEVSTLAGAPLQAGSVDGSGAAARFFEPNGIAADAAGNVYVVDSSRHTVRKITPAGFVTTLAGTGDRGAADGDAATAQFSSPAGIVADSGGNLYVTDFANSTIRKITPAGIVSTVAGLAGERGSDDGIGSSARFDSPYGIAVDGSGTLYVADQVNTIRKITPEGVVSTLAGTAQLGGSDDGAGSAATFQSPQGLDVDADGNVYVADTYNHTIRKITPAGVVSTLAGSPGLFAFADGIGSAARFNTPTDVAVDSAGHVYVADQFNYTIRRIEPDGTVTTVAGARDSFGVRLGPLPGSLGEIRSIALLPDPQPRLVETDGEKGILLITLP